MLYCLYIFYATSFRFHAFILHRLCLKMWIWGRMRCSNFCERHSSTFILTNKTQYRSVQDTSARANKGLTDTPLSTSFLGLTCLFGLQGLFGFMPHGLAVLLEFVVACLFPWSRTDFQKISAIHQELQLPVTLQTCGEDKSKTAHEIILSKLILKDRFVGYFPQHPFYEGRTNKKDCIVALWSNWGRNPPIHSWVQLLRKKT